MNFTSKLVQESVEAFSSLPGIGKKSALRLVLYLMNQPKDTTSEFTAALLNMRENIKTCSKCHNISDTEVCGICTDMRRDQSIVCIVENIRDVMAIEDTGQFRGQYHVLGGVISPIEGVGPADLNIASLEQRIQNGEIKEVIAFPQQEMAVIFQEEKEIFIPLHKDLLEKIEEKKQCIHMNLPEGLLDL